MLFPRFTGAFLPFIAVATAAAAGRVVETVLPALSYSPSCTSNVDIENLGDRAVAFEIEAHRSSGALVPFADHQPNAARLQPGEHITYRAGSGEDTTGAWAKIREKIPAAQLSPVLAISGKVECIAGNELLTASREVSYPSRNPWFSGDISELRNGIVSMINTSEQPAMASLCYASRTLFSVPGKTPDAQLLPLCSSAFDVQVPPFGSREFPVEQGGNSYFSIRTRGQAVVLHMLRPVEARVNLYSVDSTIVFGGEAPPYR